MPTRKRKQLSSAGPTSALENEGDFLKKENRPSRSASQKEVKHFVAVFFVENNALTRKYNIFWDLEKFRRATHFVAVFFVENNALTR